MRRLEKQRAQILKYLCDIGNGKSVRKNKSLHGNLACDSHFYFICIDKVNKLLHTLYDETGDIDIKKLEKRLNKIFDIKTIRDHLEHIDERIIGFLSKRAKSKNTHSNIFDYGSFINNDFSFHNKKFPCSKESLDELKKIYRALIKIIDNKCKKNPRFVKRQEVDKYHRKLGAALRKAGLF